MFEATRWEFEVTAGLNAHFFQEDGTSRPGTDWAVSVRDGKTEYRILVRTYRETPDPERETRAVFDRLKTLLAEGWTPTDWKGVPGEISIFIVDSTRPDSCSPETVSPRPWWKLW